MKKTALLALLSAFLPYSSLAEETLKAAKPPAQITTTDRNDEALICDQDYLAEQATDGEPSDTVRYRCRTEAEKLSQDTQAQRGGKELKDLKQELLEQSGHAEHKKEIVLPTEVIETIVEQTEATGKRRINEKPATIEELSQMSRQPAEIPALSEAKGSRLPFISYLSLRANSSNTSDNSELTDGGTRFGAFAVKKLDNDKELIGHVEVGLNLFDSLSYRVTPDASGSENDPLNWRLAYASYGDDDLHVDVGKNWSVYYDIAGMTDRLIALGGTATGIYNAGSDGGASGTGRADRVVQLRSSTGNWQWGLQVQAPNIIPNIEGNEEFDYGYGGSVFWKTVGGFSIGTAYNSSVIDRITPAMRAQGLTGDSQAAVIGVQWEHPRWFLSGTAHLSENHEADAKDQYFDARGYEAYGSYILTPKWMVRGGYNDLKPTNDSYNGRTHRQEIYFSLQYMLKRKLLDDLIYLEYKWDQGERYNGESGKNLLLVGIRYNLTY